MTNRLPRKNPNAIPLLEQNRDTIDWTRPSVVIPLLENRYENPPVHRNANHIVNANNVNPKT